MDQKGRDLTEVVRKCEWISGLVVVLYQCRFPVWDDYTAVVLESVLVLENHTGVFKEEGTPYLQVARKSSRNIIMIMEYIL